MVSRGALGRFRRHWWRILSVLALLVVPASYVARGALVRDVSVVVDTGRRFQTIRDWEATARLWEFSKKKDRYEGGWIAYTDEIFARAIDELGLTRLRIEMGSGIENPVDYWAKFEKGEIGYLEYKRHFYEKINDDADPAHANPGGFQWSSLDYRIEKMLLPLKRRAEARGQKLSVNLCYVDFKWSELRGNLEHAESPAEYAEFVALAFERLKQKYGIVPDYFEPILEPDNTSGWSGSRIGAGIKAAMERLATSGLRPRVIAPSTADPNRAPETIDDMTAVPGVREWLSTLSYHRYGSAPRAALPSIVERARKLGLETGMLEYTTASDRDLFEDLALGDVSAFQQYQIAGVGDAKSKVPYFVFQADAEPGQRVRLGEHARFMAQLMKHVRPGAVRLAATSDDAETQQLAFVNAGGAHVLVLRVARRSRLSLRGLPAGTYRGTYTSMTQEAASLPDLVVAAGRASTVEMPEAGVLTLVESRP